MLKNQDIICISSIDWDFIWQGHQEIMSTLAKNGNRVLFIENTGVRTPGLRDISRIRDRIKNWFKGVKGIRKEKENLYVFSPVILPFPYSRIARWINKYLMLSVIEKWMKIMDSDDPIIWVFLPTGMSLDLLNSINKRLVIYYCLDNFKAVSYYARKIERYEAKILKKSDLVFVTADILYNRCKKYSEKVYKFPFGVNISKFNIDTLDHSFIPSDIKDIRRPIIGFSGGVRKWIDIDLMKHLAKSNPDFSFVIVGPLQMDVRDLSFFKNIHFLGQKNHDELPYYINRFDVAIIPYLLNEFTECIFPAKLTEYLALGKPVVSTNLPEVVKFKEQYGDIIYTTDSKENFNFMIKKIMQGDNEIIINRRIAAAKENSWSSRIEKMSQLIQEEIEKKKIDREVRWKENLTNLYRVARKKIWSLAISCILLYFLLFNTPFLWFLASPLKISEAPQKVDAILVFGGGVGETGSPGKSTIERTRYAAELYKQGYSNKILFSSGYTYVYNDAENMKLFAISMGVPEKDILLEQKANSAYENVIFSKKVLNQNNYRTVLLISSPYNMMRSKLVFDKLSKDVKVIYVPVNNSQFYNRDEGARLEQIKAIMHEYLGIIYYWVKGYI